jgi:membrane-bound lytic murein transglycosylase B
MKKTVLILLSFVFIFDLLQGLNADSYKIELGLLNKALSNKGVPEDWLWQEIKRAEFKIYPDIPKKFIKIPEKLPNDLKKAIRWHEDYFLTPKMYASGLKFLAHNKADLKGLTLKNGIDYRIIAAIIGIETNYAHKAYVGHYETFSALVSQYILMENRRNFALQQLYYLYLFSNKYNLPQNYFQGSYAGACGYPQFIPSSLYHYFISLEKGIRPDIYSLKDSLASIENYLYAHGLNKENMEQEEALKKAIYSYNHSHAYVHVVYKLYLYFKLHDQS